MPVAAVWAAILALRHALYDWGVLPSRPRALPTLVIGNVELGGTGKTPHVLDVAHRLERLLGEGTVGILSRGYGRKTTGFLWVKDAETWRDSGDEPWMMQSRLPTVDVAVCEDRLHGLQRMAATRPALRVVVLDDGMQHRALRPDVLVGLVGRPSPHSWRSLIPAGPLRDLPSRLRRCDHLVDTSGHHPQCSWASRTASAPPQRWAHGGSDEGASLREPALLVTGIARPGRALEGAQQHAEVAAHAFYPDHHAFTQADVNHWMAWMKEAGISSLVTTEKDAVRLRPFEHILEDVDVWVLPLTLVWHTEARVQAFLETWTQTLPSQSKPPQ